MIMFNAKLPDNCASCPFISQSTPKHKPWCHAYQLAEDGHNYLDKVDVEHERSPKCPIINLRS